MQAEAGQAVTNRLNGDETNSQHSVVEDSRTDRYANIGTQQTHFAFISLLRVIAMLMVVYDHTCPFILNGLGVGWLPMRLIDRFIVQPFGIVDNFGYMGCCLFYLISGFLTAQSLRKDTRTQFAKKRFIRIVSAMVIATAFLYLFQYGVGRLIGTPTYWAQFSLIEWVKSAFLVPYFIGQMDMIFGVTWFLAPLVMFYVCNWLLIPVAKRTPSFYILIALGINFLNLTIISRLHLPGLNLGRLYSFTVIPLLGEIIYWLYTKDLSIKRGVIYCGIVIVLYLWGIFLYYPESTAAGGPLRCTNLFYAVCLFTAALALERNMPRSKIVDAVDKYSMAVYLCHMQVAQLLLPVLIPAFGVSIAMVTVYVAIALSAIFQTLLSQMLNYRVKDWSKKEK